MNYKNLFKNLRIAFLIIAIFLVIILHRLLSGSWVPNNSNITFVFQNLLLMIILGYSIVESKFTKPVDALMNSILVIIALLSLRSPNQYIAWKINLIYACIIFFASLTSILLSSEVESNFSIKNRIARIFYTIAIIFGRSEIIFSISFLLAIFSFFSSQQKDFLVLIIFWSLILILKPINLYGYLKNLKIIKGNRDIKECGTIVEVQAPGKYVIEVFKDINAKEGDVLLINKQEINILMINKYYSSLGKTIIEAINIKKFMPTSFKKLPFHKEIVYFIGDLENLKNIINIDTDLNIFKKIVGIVVENSNIGEIIFEFFPHIMIEEGDIVEINIDAKQILYQIVNARTDIDNFSNNLKIGKIKTIAQQVGIWNSEKVRFEKYGWVPQMHTPLFLVDREFKIDYVIKENEIILGYIPNTNFPIIANIDTLVTHHTAILGITGSGKTELAYTLIESMMKNKIKIFCVDFTGDYLIEFKDLDPVKLAITSEKAKELNEKLFAVETGPYGAGAELKEFEKFKSQLIPEIGNMVKDFIESDSYLGIFELSEIANTSATIAITEFYISQIFNYARNNRELKKKFCIVLEEAHTVIPESQTMGVQDKYSKATISKICQIALQGRKYNVGLLVIAQRTANVTKTVLNQCNSIIVFNSYDKTGFDFLENYVGPGMISAIPNLKSLNALVVGRAFKIGCPIVMEIPFKEKFKN